MSKTLHKGFITYAAENGINLHHSDDYEEWYLCWIHGYDTGLAKEDYEPWVELPEENNQCQQ